MKAVLQKYKVWIALLIVVLASWWVSGMDEEAPQDKSAPRAPRPAAAAAASTQKSVKTAGLQSNPAEALAVIAKGFAPREAVGKLQRDPFTIVSFEPPPPPPPPPPKPTAPPLNFKYLGALREDQEENKAEGKGRAVFLDSGGQMLIARKGDTLAGQYRVLEINDTNMQLEYLPLAERQTLNFGR